MSNYTVIVTGASRGLGEATATIVGALGATVVLTSRSESDLRRVAAAIDEADGKAHVIPGDISQPEACERAVEQTIEKFGRLDAIVNNAGVMQPLASIADGDPVIWTRNVLVNLAGLYYLTHFALPYLRNQQGRVLNVSSGSAVHADVGWSAYCAAKAGVNHFTRVLAAEEPALTAIAFRPGKMDTAMQAVIRDEGQIGMPPDRHAQFVKYHEEGALLPPRVVGRALAVLALHAPREWSGEFIALDDERLEALVAEKASMIGEVE